MGAGVLLPAVLALAFGSITAAFSCKNLSSDSCTCSGHSSSLFELTCPTLYVQVQINLGELVQLQCSSSDSMGFSTLSGLHIGDVDRFILRLCPLPDMEMRELMAKIGISKIKMLQIQSYNRLNDTLQKKHFEKLFDVTTLSLDNNGLTSLPGDIFEDMGNLTWLDMKYNQIDLPKEIFYFTPRLEVLELGMNNLTHLKPGIFKNLDRLRLLNLWSNKLTNLTRSVFSDVPNLESLDLNTNQMENIRPDLFADLIKLKQLNLYGNKFSSLPLGLLSGNIYLEEFQMHDNNRLLTLPPGFLSNLIKLKIVRLSRSKITSLPENIFAGSKNITSLYLNENLLSTLSKDTFAGLEVLEHLYLSVNNIQHLPDKLFYYTSSLKTLKLDHNNIVEIPPELFSNLEKLEYLDLRYNRIKSITGEQFFGLASLKTLNISDNQLTSLAPEVQLKDFGSYSVLLKNTQLEDLQLANNYLNEIYVDWKLVLKKLQVLNVSFNQFEYLKTDDLEFYGDIYLDLSNNNISLVNFWDARLIAAGILDGFNSSYVRDQQIRSKIVKLDNNPFNCDCQLLPFVQFIHNDLSPEVQYLYNIPGANLKCHKPANLEKMSLKYVPYSLLTCDFRNNTEYTCPGNCVCQYRAVDKGNIINCQNVGLTQIPSSLSTYKSANHTEIYLENNRLTNIKIPANKGYENVTHYNLAHNNISNINISGFSRQLKVLDVSNNNLTSMDSETIHFLENAEYLESLALNGNPWQCDCGDEDLITLISHGKVEGSNTSCPDGSMLGDLQDRCHVLEMIRTLTIKAGLAAMLGVLSALLTILYYRNERVIHAYCITSKYKLLRWLVSKPDSDEDKIYDAFIVYSHEDEDFVTHQLIPYLEQSFTLCVHYQHWVPGESIYYQIFDSVQKSRRTIVVLSPNFLKSYWGILEFKTAHQQALEDGKARVIPILYQDLGPIDSLDEELKLYLQMNTYVKWGSPWFWEQLSYAMPHPTENPEDIICIFCCLRRKKYKDRTDQIVQIRDMELRP